MHSPGEEERHHDREEDQDRDQRNAPYNLDEPCCQLPEDGHARRASQSQGDSEGKRDYEGYDRHKQCDREATDEEISGATYADGLGSAVAGVFGGLPNTSFSQNVGIVGMTGVMSRHVVTIGAIVLVVCGLIPKIGAIIASMPLPVLGGGVIVMFGMVAAAGLNVLSEVKLNRRNMVIIAVSLAVGLGLNLVPSAVQYLPGVVKVLATSAVAPTAIVAVILNLVLPEED